MTIIDSYGNIIRNVIVAKINKNDDTDSYPKVEMEEDFKLCYCKNFE